MATGKKEARYHHGDLRRALVVAARAVVEREGPDAVSLRDVARRAGVSQAAPYHHFANKEALLAAVAAEGYRELAASMLSHGGSKKDAFGHFQGLGVGYVVYAVAHPALFRLMQGPRTDAGPATTELAEAANESFDLLRGAVAACLPLASALQQGRACAAAWSLVHGMATLCVDGRMSGLLDIGDPAKAARLVTGQLDISRVLEN